MSRCKEEVWRGYHGYPCSREAIDERGWCKQHTPEAKQARDEKARLRYAEMREQARMTRERGAVQLLESLGYTVTPPAASGGPGGDHD